MKILIYRIPDCTIQRFADKYELIMEVGEQKDKSERYIAKFLHVDDISDGPVLHSVYGVGCSPHAAISDYVGKISGKTLKISLPDLKSRYVDVPELEPYNVLGTDVVVERNKD